MEIIKREGRAINWHKRNLIRDKISTYFATCCEWIGLENVVVKDWDETEVLPLCPQCFKGDKYDKIRSDYKKTNVKSDNPDTLTLREVKEYCNSAIKSYQEERDSLPIGTIPPCSCRDPHKDMYGWCSNCGRNSEPRPLLCRGEHDSINHKLFILYKLLAIIQKGRQ